MELTITVDASVNVVRKDRVCIRKGGFAVVKGELRMSKGGHFLRCRALVQDAEAPSAA